MVAACTSNRANNLLWGRWGVVHAASESAGISPNWLTRMRLICWYYVQAGWQVYSVARGKVRWYDGGQLFFGFKAGGGMAMVSSSNLSQYIYGTDAMMETGLIYPGTLMMPCVCTV